MGLFSRLRRRLKRKKKRRNLKGKKRLSRQSKLRRLLKAKQKNTRRKSSRKKPLTKKEILAKRTRKVKRLTGKKRTIKRPKKSIKFKPGKKLTAQQKKKALEYRNKRRVQVALIKEKSEQAKDAQDQKLEEAVAKRNEKLGIKQEETQPVTVNELMYELKDAINRQYVEHGRSAPAYSGTVTEIISPTEVKVDVPFTDHQLDTGFLWRDFTINYPVNESVEISGTELEEKDLVIGEQEFDIEQKTLKLQEITTRSEELVTRVLQFFALNGFLTGSLDETHLLSQDQAQTIKKVSEALEGAQDKFTITSQHSASLAAIHKDPRGCRAPEDIIAPDVIPVFEFYNPISDDYFYSVNQEWNYDQDAGDGYAKFQMFKEYIETNRLETVEYHQIQNDFKREGKGPTAVDFENAEESDGKLRMNWGKGSPAQGATDHLFTTLWEGYWKPLRHGKVQLSMKVDNSGFIDICEPGGQWRRILNTGWGDRGLNGGMGKESETFNVPKEWVDKDIRIPIRWMQSENTGDAQFRIGQKYLDAPDEVVTKKVPIYAFQNIGSIRWFKKRPKLVIGYKTVKYNLSDKFLDCDASQISLAAPGNWKYNTVAFGAYDPLQASHMKATMAVPVHKFTSGPIKPDYYEAAGRTLQGNVDRGSPSRANEAAGIHYLAVDKKAPEDNTQIDSKDWNDLGTEFYALSDELPSPHPTFREEITLTNNQTGAVEEVVVEQGKALPVHYFYNKASGTYRFRIIEDGRTRQARTTEGVLKESEDGIPVMEKTEIKIGTNFTPELAGGSNAAAKDGKGKPAPAIQVGEGYEWKGIAFYAYEPPGLPPNVHPIIQIYINNKLAPENYQVRAKWLHLDHPVSMTAKAMDSDGRITKYTWRLVNQKSDIRGRKGEKPRILARDASLKYTFPIGRTRISCTVEDNRGDSATDTIDIIVLAPERKNWQPWTYDDMNKLQGNQFNVPYYYHRRRRWRRDVRKTVNVPYNKQAYDFYQLGFKDGQNDDDPRDSAALDRFKFGRTRTVPYQVATGRRRKRRWGRRRWVTNYTTKYRKEHYSESGKDLTSHNWLRQRNSHVRSIGMAESEIDNRMKKIYNLGYNHGKKGPHYLIDNDLASNIRGGKNLHPRQLKGFERLRPPKKVRNRIKKALTVPKKIRNKVLPPKKVRKAVKKAARKIKKFFKRWSDVRLKTNINYIRTSKSGINVYEYNYIWSSKKYRGVMAQELLEKYPQAVGKRLGYYTVDYDRLDVNFEEVDGRRK